MSYFKDMNEDLLKIGIDGEQACFMCGKPTGFPRVYWKARGVGGIALHPECASDLAIRMARDVWEWEKATQSRRQPRDG